MITRDEEFKEKTEGFILADIEVCIRKAVQCKKNVQEIIKISINSLL